MSGIVERFSQTPVGVLNLGQLKREDVERLGFVEEAVEVLRKRHLETRCNADLLSTQMNSQEFCPKKLRIHILPHLNLIRLIYH